MPEQSHPLYMFLSLSRGSWRNAVYIECNACPYKKSKCHGHLLICDTEGIPVLFSVDTFEKLTADFVDKSECVGIITRQTFESLFNRWLVWNINKPKECSILQLLPKTDRNTP